MKPIGFIIMRSLSRRSFAAGLGTLAGGGTFAAAIEIPQRINPKIRGLSLAAYSLRTELRWMKGKDTGAEMEILDVLDYAAEQLSLIHI